MGQRSSGRFSKGDYGLKPLSKKPPAQDSNILLLRNGVDSLALRDGTTNLQLGHPNG